MHRIGLFFVLFILGCSKKAGVTLPDGRQVTVAAVSYGTNHSSRNPTFGAAGDFALGHLSPKNWRLIPEACLPGANFDTELPRLVLFLRSRTGVDPTRPPLVSVTVPYSSHQVGHLEELHSLSEFISGTHYAALVADLFPRRARELTFEVHNGYDYDGERRALRGVPNPVPAPGPSWNPDLLPATQSREGVTVTLTDLYARDVPVLDEWTRPRKIPERQTQVEAVVEDSKHRAVPVFLQRLSDPGGNVLLQHVGQLYREAISRFAGSLFDDEPSWRLDLETELPESLDPSHPNDERFVLKDLKEEPSTNLSAPPYPIQISQRFPELKITQLNAYAGQNPSIVLWLDHRPKGVRVTIVEARDETGHAWIPEIRRTSDRGLGDGEDLAGRDGIYYGMHRPGWINLDQVEAKSLTITLRIFRTAVFTFHPPSKFRPPARSLGLPMSGLRPER